ncbi:hypothetical protein, partial [Escherichia coli]|uniref:hypothetical protein n=1 Tax=Escherichia coli TaxID=562 RepID=UPI001BFDF285
MTLPGLRVTPHARWSGDRPTLRREVVGQRSQSVGATPRPRLIHAHLTTAGVRQTKIDPVVHHVLGDA